VQRFVIDGVRGMLEEADGVEECLLAGWIVVTGVVAWDGNELITRHAGTLLEDAPRH
jgi:hypothetical protein